jgi:branched-chain amino acid transport system permease protein
MPDALTVAARANHVLVGVLILAGLAFAAIGAAQNDTFYLRLATEALIFGGLALSVDILLGYTGLLSLGQALYFGLGAYLSALVLKAVPSFWLALAAGLGAGLVLGLVGGIIAIRVRGVYFALITFGLAQVVAKVVYNTRALGASDGLLGVPIIDIDLGVVSVSSASPAGFFLVVLAVIMGLYAVSAYILDTPFGRLLIALRANDRRVPFLGYRTASLRLSSFVFAAVIATVSGTLYPMLRGFRPCAQGRACGRAALARRAAPPRGGGGARRPAQGARRADPGHEPRRHRGYRGADQVARRRGDGAADRARHRPGDEPVGSLR